MNKLKKENYIKKAKKFERIAYKRRAIIWKLNSKSEYIYSIFVGAFKLMKVAVIECNIYEESKAPLTAEYRFMDRNKAKRGVFPQKFSNSFFLKGNF